jgi:hypothetical protein
MIDFHIEDQDQERDDDEKYRGVGKQNAVKKRILQADTSKQAKVLHQ